MDREWLAVLRLDGGPAAALLRELGLLGGVEGEREGSGAGISGGANGDRRREGAAAGDGAGSAAFVRGPFAALMLAEGGGADRGEERTAAPAWAATAGGLVAAGRLRLDDRAGLRRRLGRVAEDVPPGAGTADDLRLAALAFERRAAGRLPDLAEAAEAAAGLLGDFGLVLWHPGRRGLLAVRDPLGVVPLHLRRVSGAVLFASSPHLLRRLPPRLDALDDAVLADFLLFDVPMEPGRSPFRGLERVPPGHVLALGEGGERQRRFWHPSDVAPWRPRPGEAVERFREVFARAVADRVADLPADAPAGVLLSGGLDGSLVAATLARGLGRPVRGYVHVFERLLADDSARRAALAAGHLGVPLDVTAGDGFTPWRDRGALLGRAALPINEPFFALTTALTARAAAQGCRVVLTGEGADDLCWVVPDDVLSWLLAEPFAATGALLAMARAGVPWASRRLPRVGLRSALFGRLGLRHRAAWRPRWPPWLDVEAARRLELPARGAAVAEAPAPRGPRAAAVSGLAHPRFEMLHRWYDVPAAAAGVEVRHPFLDRRVVELLLSLPPLPGARRKAVLREAARGLLPDAVRRRPKTLLPAEPLVSHFQNPDWDPAPHLDLDPRVAELVDAAELRRRLASPAPLEVWADVRPVSLSWWVRGLQ